MSEFPFPAGLFISFGNDLFFGIPVFTSFFALAFMAAIFFIRYDCQRKNLNINIAQNAVILSFITGILGARFFSVFDHIDKFWVSGTNLFSGIYTLLFYEHGLKEIYPQAEIYGFYEIFFSNSGFVFFGGLLFAFPALLFYFKFNKVSILPYLDSFAMAMALGYGIGRLGCMISGDGCFGQACPIHIFPISLVYGPESGLCNTDPAFRGSNPLFCTYGTAVWNTPFIEAMASFLVFIILFKKSQNKLPKLWITAIILMQNAGTRFFVEFLRLNDAVWPILPRPKISIHDKVIALPHLNEILHQHLHDKNLLASFYKHWYWYGFTSAQLYSIGIFITGVALYRYSQKNK